MVRKQENFYMRYKKEIIIIGIITLLVLFLRIINVFQIENGLANPFVMILIIIIFSFITIQIQRNIDHNYQRHKMFYSNLDILKYISSILIIILHLRPFLNISNELDLAFNNIITRICVPIFFIITGYFVAKKEKDNLNYIDHYIKKTIPLYLIWSLLYLIFLIAIGIPYIPSVLDFLSSLHIPLYLLIIGCIVLLPLVLVIALAYTGVYYHL